MLHMRIPLQPHEFRHAHRAVFADAAQIIAQQIGDHHQLRHFLGAGLEFVGELGVAIRIGRARARAFDRPRQNVRATEPQEKLRRRRGNLKIAAIQERREWGGGHAGEFFVELPAAHRARRRQPVREIDLVNVARANVALRPLNRRDEFRAGHCRGDVAFLQILTSLTRPADTLSPNGGEGRVRGCSGPFIKWW